MGYAPYLYRLLSDTQYEVRYPGDQPWFIENYLMRRRGESMACALTIELKYFKI